MLQLVVGVLERPFSGHLEPRAQAPTALAEAQCGCHHSPVRASQGEALLLPWPPQQGQKHLDGGCGKPRAAEGPDGGSESSVPGRGPGRIDQDICPEGRGEIREVCPHKVKQLWSCRIPTLLSFPQSGGIN